MSETVRNLERELGVDLLERKRSGPTMSADGRELLPKIVDVLDAVDRLRSAVGGRRSAVGGRRSAVGGRRSAVGGRRSAVGGRRVAPDQPHGARGHGQRGDRAAARHGAITYRPIAGDTPRVLLMPRRRRAESVPQAAGDLHEAFVRRARELSEPGT